MFVVSDVEHGGHLLELLRKSPAENGLTGLKIDSNLERFP